MTNRNLTNFNKLFTTPYLARIAVLAGLGAALSMLEFPIFPAAPFFKLDPSGVAVLLAGFAMGLPAGALTLLIKDLIGLLIHPSGGWVGQLADFIALFAFIVPALLIYYGKKTRTNALIGMIAGTVTMVLAAIVANVYILFPFYHVPNAETYIIPFIIPFNLIKGVGLTLITFFIYKPLSPILKGKIKSSR